MPESLWIWDERVNQYRDTATGRFVGVVEMNLRRNEFIDRNSQVMNGFVDQFTNGDIDIYSLRDAVQLNLKNTYIDMYAMGAGGRNSMSPADWGRVGAILKEQYGYLRNMFDQLARGELSPMQLKARLKMYLNSANEALWRGITSNYDFKLPAYPGDGSTECLVNCRCEWEIVEVPGGYDCYWRLKEAEHCPDCLDRESEWNPWRWRVSNE